MGSRVENEIANALTSTPQLVKLGVTMEFRDSLNKSAIQLQKNLDRRMFYRLSAFDCNEIDIIGDKITYPDMKKDILYFRATNRR